MRYNIEGYAETDFQVMDRLVRSVFLASGRVDVWNTLRRVTTKTNEVSPMYRQEIHDKTLSGATLRAACIPVQHNGYEFDIWVNPTIVSERDEPFKATLLHELCHGYLGTHMGHERSWRRFYTRTLWHYHRQIAPLSHLEPLVDLVFWRYTKRVKGERTHEFLQRIRQDKKDVLAYADLEADRVQQIFKRIT